jgi:hypothetical protein
VALSGGWSGGRLAAVGDRARFWSGFAVSGALAPWWKPTAVQASAKVVRGLAVNLALGGDSGV